MISLKLESIWHPLQTPRVNVSCLEKKSEKRKRSLCRKVTAAKGDAKTAITEGAADFVKGEAISQVAQRTVIPAVQKVLPSFVGGLAKIAPLFTSLSVGAEVSVTLLPSSSAAV